MMLVCLLAASVPFGLTVEYRENPIGIDAYAPRLGWKLPEGFDRQSAYEIDSPHWKSGKIESDRQVSVPWKGARLSSGERVSWRVRVWDGARVSDWSRPAAFTMGILRPEDWRAKWIGPSSSTRPPIDLDGARWIESATSNVFRKSFVLESVPKGISELVFTSRDAYKVWLNGNVVADTYWEHFHDWRWLRTLDVSMFLRTGENELVFAVKPLPHERPSLIASLACGDGRIVSDASWGAVVTGWPVKGWRELEPPAFEKAFAVSGVVARATLYVTGVGYYEASLNGQRIGEKVLDPSPTAFDKRVLYSTYHLDSALRSGTNRLSVLVGHGLYDQRSLSAWNFDSAPWRDFPRMIAQLEIDYSDGRKQTVISDASWRQVKSPVRYDDIREGEIISPGCVGDVGLAEEVPGPRGILAAESQPGSRIIRTLRPLSIRSAGERTWIVSFSENISGWMRMRLSGLQPGTELSFTYDERLAADGTPALAHDWRKGVWGVGNDGSLRMIDMFLIASMSYRTLSSEAAFQRDRYIAVGADEERYEPRFTYNGFQHVTIRGLATRPRAEDVEACVISTDFPETGSFSCSDERFNRLMAAAGRSYRSNFTNGFPTDCPHREKNGWTGDASLAVELAQYLFDNTAGYEKWLQDLLDAQLPSGEIPCIVPTSGWGFAWGNGPTFDAALLEVPWQLYLHKGDVEVLRRAYPACVALSDFVAREKTHNGLVDWGLGDHAHVGGKSGAPTREYVASCLNLKNNLMSVGMAEALGRPISEIGRLRQRAEVTRSAVRRKYAKESGVFDNGGETAEALAIECGLVDSNGLAEAGRALVAAFAKADDHFDVGIFGFRHVLKALSRIGRSDLAFKALLQPTFPTPQDWVSDGSTTLWEDWKGRDGSRNHIMFGSFAAWAYGHLAGIRPLEPGYRRILFAPETVTALEHVTATVETPYGMVSSAWRRQGGEVSFVFFVPGGTTAELRLPHGLVETLGPGRHVRQVRVKEQTSVVRQ